MLRSDQRIHPSQFEAGQTVVVTGKATGTTTSTTVIVVGAIAAVVVTVAAVTAVAVVLTRNSAVECTGITEAACSSSLNENSQDIATDCPQDIGICSSDSCEECDSKCCGAIFETRTSKCGGDDVLYAKVVSCSCVACDAREVSVSGRVIGHCSGNCAASVQLNGKEVATSNVAGYFTFSTTYPSNGKINLEVIPDSTNFLSQPQQVEVSVEAQSYVNIEIPIVERAQSKPIDASAGGSIEVGENADVTFTIPAEAIYTEDGQLFKGTADVSTNFVDPASAASANDVVVPLFGADDSGTLTPMSSSGMLRVTATSADNPNQKLQIKGLQIDLAETSQAAKSAGLTTYLWVYDNSNGGWEKVGQPLSQGRSDRYGRSLLTASFDISTAQQLYNLDALLSNYCFMKVETLKDELSSDKALGVLVRALYKPEERAWSNVIRRRTSNNGVCVEVPCNRASWPGEKVNVEVAGFIVHDPNVDDDTLVKMNYTVDTKSFDITIPETGDIPTSSKGPFFTTWDACFFVDGDSKSFKFVRTLVGKNETTPTESTTTKPTVTTKPTEATSTSSMRCQSVSLDENVFDYFDRTTSFDASLYQLLPDGLMYNDLLITGESISLSELNTFDLSIFSKLEGILHHLSYENGQLVYKSETVTSDPFNGADASVPGDPALPISVSFKISGNIVFNGVTYKNFVVDSVSVPGGVSVDTSTALIVTQGVTASDCFAYATNATVTEIKPTPPDPAAVTKFLYCDAVDLAPEVLTYFDSSTGFDDSLYEFRDNGVFYNERLITGEDISLEGLNYLHLSVFSRSEGVLHHVYGAGTELIYSRNSTTTDPFVGTVTNLPSIPSLEIGINFAIGGNIGLGDETYQRFVIGGFEMPGGVSVGTLKVTPEITARNCFAHTTTTDTIPKTRFAITESTHFVYCDSVTLGQEVLTYFDATTSFDVNLYTLLPNGLSYNNLAITATGITLNQLSYFHLSAFSSTEGVLHQLYTVGPELNYLHNTTTNDPFNGTPTTLPGGLPSVDISFKIGGIIELDGTAFEVLVIDSNRASAPSGVSVADITVAPGISASNCFAHIPTDPPSENQLPITESTNFVYCDSVALGQEVLTYFDATTSFDVNLYTLLPNGLSYNNLAITATGILLNQLSYFHLSVFSSSEGVLHRLYTVGSELSYSRNTTTEDPFNGTPTTLPGGLPSVEISLKIGGIIELDDAAFEVLVIDSNRASAPSGVPMADITVAPGISASSCFSHVTTQSETNTEV